MAMRLANGTRTLHPYYGLVDALVTLAVIAWFSAALVLMVGEFRGAPSSGHPHFTQLNPTSEASSPGSVTVKPWTLSLMTTYLVPNSIAS